MASRVLALSLGYPYFPEIKIEWIPTPYGLMVRALDSGLRGLGLRPGRVDALCFWAKHFALTMPLPTQEYQWVQADC